ncbi:MAG: FAD-dependent oxidoreductase [Acidobacteriota bacterium]
MAEILVEADSFDDFGGWILDSQFESKMGSSYLMAHGLGRPVANAQTEFTVPMDGTYTVWVRTKDWVPEHHPGRFRVLIDGRPLEREFGASGLDWSWENGGEVTLSKGRTSLTLQDSTGFSGRCDAIYLVTDGRVPTNSPNEEMRAWRKELKGLPEEPVVEGDFDLVVIGGGVSGCAAALTAARLDQTVALIQDRPVLGGNASPEIGIMPRGAQGELLAEIGQREGDGNLKAQAILEAHPNVSLYLGHRLFAVHQDGNRITSVDAVETLGGVERRFNGKVFIDSSGVAMVAVLGGGETRFGREAQSEYGESHAPENADEMHHGNTLFFRTRMAEKPVPFPDVPWATEISKDYADLGGQILRPGKDNGPGPRIGNHPHVPEFQFPDDEDVFTASHFWEYGQWLDPYKEGERIRDHLMRALFGTFSNVKTMDPEKHANLEFEYMAHVVAKGEYRRHVGDYTLSQVDIIEHREFEDDIVMNAGFFCVHCAFPDGEAKYDFRLEDWIMDLRDSKPYAIPYRCLYSASFDNLLLAGKHISVTHVAATSAKFMGNGAQHGIASAAAASICNAYGTTPRGVYEEHLQELKETVAELTAHDHRHFKGDFELDAANH